MSPQKSNDKDLLNKAKKSFSYVQETFNETYPFLELALKSAGMSTWLWDIKENKRYFDEQTCQLLGINPKMFNGTADEFYNIVYPDDRELLKEALKNAIDSNTIYEPEYRVIWPDNSLHYITARGKLVCDSDGNPSKINGLIWDITDRKKADKALKHKDELLKMTSQMAKIGGWEFNAQTHKGTWTDEVARIHGLDPKIETNVELGLRFYTPNSRLKLETAIKEAIEQALPYDLELELISEDNEHKWVRTIGLPVIKNNKVAKVEGIFQDITEQKRTELELEDSKQQLRFALEGSNDGLWDVKMKTGEVYLSPRGCEILGYSPDELSEIIKIWSDLVHPDDLPETNQRLQAHINGENKIFEIEQRLQMKSGQWKWVLTRGKVVTRDKDGSPLRMTGTHTDITKRKKAEEAICDAQLALLQQNEEYLALNEELNESNNRIQAINQDLLTAKERAEESEQLKSYILHKLKETEKIAKIGSWEWDIQSNTVWWSDEVYRIFELESDYYTPSVEANALFIHPDDREAYQKTFFNCIETGNLLDFDLRIITPSGKTKNCKSKGKVYFNASKIPLRFTGFILDTSLQEQTQNELLLAKEKAEESDRLKTAFLNNMSHEIRTPMNAIIGFSDLLCETELTDTQKKQFISIIKQRTYDLLQIIENILDISKIEVGQMKMVESDVHLPELLDNIYEEYNQKLQDNKTKHGITLNLKIDDSLAQPSIKSDKKRLTQILCNLIDNAIKFTHKGSIEFGCKAETEHELIFYVRDTGIGVPVEKQQLIFNHFRQADEALTTRLYEGTGLGLSIAKGLVTLLNGRIGLDSKVNEGSTFWFSLPTTLPTILPNNKTAPSDIKPIDIPQTILVVEDDPSNAEYLKIILSASGFDILHAYDGFQTLEIFHTVPSIKLILMDIRLPDTNGLILTQKIRQENSDVIIIAQTAYDSSADQLACINAGCNDYIAKPARSEQVLSMVKRYLN
ncbi:MAG: PAS domain-containing protein [Bacteroidota bacterium]|nr:PAS domain-containing protein [Bacteroidota bacterium]